MPRAGLRAADIGDHLSSRCHEICSHRRSHATEADKADLLQRRPAPGGQFRGARLLARRTCGRTFQGERRARFVLGHEGSFAHQRIDPPECSDVKLGAWSLGTTKFQFRDGGRLHSRRQQELPGAERSPPRAPGWITIPAKVRARNRQARQIRPSTSSADRQM